MSEGGVISCWSIPTSWCWSTLDECASWGAGGTPKATEPKYYDGGTIPWLIIKDLNDDVVSTSSKHLTELGLAMSSARWVKQGALLIAMYGSIGKLGIAGIDCTTNQAIAFTEKWSGLIDQRVLFHYLRFIRPQLLSAGKGGAQQNISQTVLKKVEIPIPPISEQKRIVKKIEELQSRSKRAREALESVPALIEKFRQSVLAAAFRGDLTKAWREKNRDKIEPASELLKRIRGERRKKWEEEQLKKFQAAGKTPKDDSWKNNYRETDTVDAKGLPELPEGWCWAELSRLASFINGDRGKNYPNRAEYVTKGIPFINAGHIAADGSLDVSSMNYITRAKLNSLSGGKIQSGDLVYCLRGTLGKVAFVCPFDEGAIASSLVIIRPYAQEFREFLYFFLVSPQGLFEIQKHDNGSAQPNLSAENVARHLVPIPPLAELGIICESIKLAWEKICALDQLVEKHLKQMTELDQSILAKAFRGELVPQNQNDEPAAVLLECIRKERESPEGKERKSSENSNRQGRKTEKRVEIGA